MKKLLIAILILGFCGVSWAGTTTSLGLYKPTPKTDVSAGEEGWGVFINSNLDILDGLIQGIQDSLIVATTSQEGFMPALDGNAAHYLDGSGNWSAPAGAPGGSGTVASGATNSVPHYTASTTLDDASGSLYDTGNVGVGTSAPQAKLAVGSTGQFQVTSAGAVTAASFTGPLTGNASTVTTNANLTGPITSSGNTTAIASQTGTGSTFVVNTSPTLVTPVLGVATGTSLGLSGNVGVGTTLISAGRLTVKGNSTTTGVGIQTQNSSGTALITTLDNGSIGVGTVSPTGILDVRGDEVRIWTGTGTNTNALASGELYIQGDLEVDGTIYGDGSQLTGISAATGWIDSGAVVSSATITDNVGVGTSTLASNAKLTIKGNGASTNISTQWQDSANAAKVTILDNGNIGVGTTLPQSKLDVSGVLTVNSGSGTPLVAIGRGTSGLPAFQTQDSNLAALATFADNGNIGIGTTAPERKFHMVGADPNVRIQSTTATSSFFGYQLKNQAGNLANISLTNSDTGNTLYLESPGALILTTSGDTDVLTATADGNVGIGSTNPSRIVDIAGNSDNAMVRITNSADSGTPLTFNNGDMTWGNITQVSGTTLGGLGVQGIRASTNHGIALTLEGYGYSADAAADLPLVAVYGYNNDAAPTLRNPFGVLQVGTDASLFNVGASGNVGIGTAQPRSILEIDKGTGTAQITIDGTTGGCLMFQDTDGAGWTECDALNGVLTCSTDLDGLCD